MRAYDASVDIGYQTLRLVEEEVSLWSPGAGPRPSSLVVAKDHVIPTQSEGIVMVRMENHLEVENGLVEPSPQAHAPDGIYVARTLVQDCQEVPVRVMNATHRDQMLRRGSPLAHCEPVTLVILPDVGQPPEPGLKPKLADVTTTAKPRLNTREFQEIEELAAKYANIFARDNEDYGRTNKVYHRTDTGDARPIRQPPRRVPLAKQAEVKEMLDNMRGQGVVEESDSPCITSNMIHKPISNIKIILRYLNDSRLALFERHRRKQEILPKFMRV
ncbi:uncharacterized protein LOC111867582 [Cryptotermes secundus]|uniref:uncharacterized protein LOC111867582 n=1 Tax=Cryptotermes secundus TaxID=105785 RepID=UPI000CD7CD02|nr:uncharacterized protein LOC111867582 [Cryptotermes secundus]